MDRILLADDDVELGEMLTQYLSSEDFLVDTAHDGETARAMARRGDYDLIVLDIMMPRINGFNVLRALRMRSLVPVLILTARGADVDSIVGLELGANDHLAKPRNPRVLVARIRAILRRTPVTPQIGEESLTLGDIEINTGTRTAYRAGDAVPLTSTEYCGLEVLLPDAGHVVSKPALSERALGLILTSYDRSLDMHVSNLRKKTWSIAEQPGENSDRSWYRLSIYSCLIGSLPCAACCREQQSHHGDFAGVGSIDFPASWRNRNHEHTARFVDRTTREIGIPMAIGARRIHVLLQFLVEAVLLSAIGSGAGVVIGVTISKIISAVAG